jgi:hypothetical protein
MDLPQGLALDRTFAHNGHTIIPLPPLALPSVPCRLLYSWIVLSLGSLFSGDIDAVLAFLDIDATHPIVANLTPRKRRWGHTSGI